MKYALILHGWPQYRVDKYFLSNHLRKLGYKVITPNMFSRGYVFTPKNVLNDIKRNLNNNGLNLIVGISLGGLILPYIATEYPKAKLIFISSGPKLKTKSMYFNIFEKLTKFLLNYKISNLLLKIPNNIFIYFYKLANPFNSESSKKEKYYIDMLKNIKFIKSIPINEEKEILNFVFQVDNTSILKKLSNKSIIFGGKNDLLMPEGGSKQLNILLKNSSLILNQGSHFDTFSKDDLNEVNRFLY